MGPPNPYILGSPHTTYRFQMNPTNMMIQQKEEGMMQNVRTYKDRIHDWKCTGYYTPQSPHSNTSDLDESYLKIAA